MIISKLILFAGLRRIHINFMNMVFHWILIVYCRGYGSKFCVQRHRNNCVNQIVPFKWFNGYRAHWSGLFIFQLIVSIFKKSTIVSNRVCFYEIPIKIVTISTSNIHFNQFVSVPLTATLAACLLLSLRSHSNDVKKIFSIEYSQHVRRKLWLANLRSNLFN